jgi:dTDP-4-dehydrorhamnose 3,5-epimerase
MESEWAASNFHEKGGSLIFREAQLRGAFIIDPDRLQDERGFFARTWCQREFADQGLNFRLVQCSISFNIRKGTWRGMHYQAAPHEEAKLVRCTRGRIWDVIVDLRSDSPTFGRHISVELSVDNHRMLYVPERFAHGFQTLEDETEVSYQMSQYHAPQSARGFRWNDPAFGIRPPLDITSISNRDSDYPDYATALAFG